MVERTMSSAALKRLLMTGIACVALLAMLATAGAWMISYLSMSQSQVAREQATVNAAPILPFSNLLASTFIEHREGRIVLVHQVVEPPPPPEVDLLAYPDNFYGSSDIKVWRVDAGNARRVEINASHVRGDVIHGHAILLGAVDPVRRPTSFLEYAGFAFRRDGGSASPLTLLAPQRMPDNLFGHPIPAAQITQVMVPHWFLLVVSAVTSIWSGRWLLRRLWL